MQLPMMQDSRPQRATAPIPGQPGPTRNVAAIMLGSRVLNKMLRLRQMPPSLSALPRGLLALLLARYGASSVESLFEDIGTGKLPASTVVSYLTSIKVS